MARKKESKLDKELRLYAEALTKAESKYKRQLRKDPELKIEDFGLSSKMFETLKAETKRGKPTLKQIREKTAQLQEYTSRAYGLKKIGTTISGGEVRNVYMPKNVYKDAIERINAQNKFRETLAKAIDKAGGYSYARLTKNGIVKEQSSYYNATISKSMDMIPERISIIGGKDIGYKGNMFSRERVMTPETFKAEYGRMASKVTSVTDTKVQILKDNWLKGLASTVSKPFAEEIRNIMEEMHIDAVDFLGLFYLTTSFDFDFIYDSELTLQNKKEEIRSEIEAFRNDQKTYEAFRKEMSKLE